MGSRVNYVVVRDGGYVLYAQGGGAGEGIDYNFALGPDITLRWLANLGDYEGADWFADGVCDGGVLVDVDRKVLLLFNVTFNSYIYRAAMLQAYASTWDGWEIRWAYDGIGDLMTYVGCDPSSVHDGERPEITERNEYDPSEPLSAIVSVRRLDGTVKLFGLNPDAAWRRWRMGPSLIDWLAAGPELAAIEKMPRAGLHLDLVTHGAGLWSVEPLCGLETLWPELWPGWTLEFWADDIARQAAHSDQLYDSVAPRAIARRRAELAERVIDYWPVRSAMLTNGVDVDWIYEHNFAGLRTQLDLNLTPEETQRAADLLRGSPPAE